MDYLQLATHYLVEDLKGKYIHLDTILSVIDRLKSDFEITEIEKPKRIEKYLGNN